jgi:prepilin-type N-terminal cleavage/methylation domain-containing protein
MIIRNKLLRIIFPLSINHLPAYSAQKGFTLIELVMVIVILGVLASVALPKFVDLKADAQDAATKGVAGAISSASSINYGARSVNVNKGVPIAYCADAGTLLQGGLPTGYVVGGTLPQAVPAGTTVNCTLTGPSSTSAIVPITGIL